jgi:hypothetical protein
LKRAPFVLGHVLGAATAGALGGSFLDLAAAGTFAALLAGNAAAGALLCWWWPGFDAAWWKLWPMASLANPLMVAAGGWSLDQWDCLVGGRTGWDCMFASLGPLAMLACLPSPLIGLAARWWVRRRSPG